MLICVFNAGQYLRPSVQSVVTQTYRNIEIIIVNDGSTDGCMETIRDLADPRIRVFHQENKGKPSALNFALGQLRGDFYAVHDADDLSDPRRIECQLKWMLENRDLAAVFCGYDVIVKNRRQAPIAAAKDRDACRRDIAAFRMPSHDPTGMYRMSLVGAERYDPDLLLGQGFDYILRLGERFPMMVVGECLYSYRVHRASGTRRNIEQREQLVRGVLRAACSRRGVTFESQFPNCVNPGISRRNRDLDNYLAAHFIDSSIDLRRAGKRWLAIRTGLECSRLHPLDLDYHKSLVYALAPMWLVRKIRRVPM